MNKEQLEKLMKLFENFVTKIEQRPTRSWRVTPIKNGLSVRCENGTSNYIHEIPTSSGVLALWNAQNPEQKLKEIEKDCIEDDDRWTRIYWKLEFI